MKEHKIFFSGGQDLCVWNEKGEMLDKMARNSEHSDIHSLLPIKNNRIVAASNKSSLVVYSVVRPADYSEKLKIVEFKKLSTHRESIRCLISVADSMFASASLDGVIVLWSSHSLSYTHQFNFVKNYEGPNHTYPASAQHVFTVDQMALNLGEEGFASCGCDGLVVLWKDGVLEKKRRNEMVRDILLSMENAP
ncbi:hypothetical protein ACROYT_G000993 [Oculina patagonica]